MTVKGYELEPSCVGGNNPSSAIRFTTVDLPLKVAAENIMKRNSNFSICCFPKL